MEALSELIGGDQNDQTVQPLATNQNDQVVQPSAVDQNDQVVQPPADEIKKARKRARRMEYLDRKKQKVEDAERELEEMKADFAKSEKDHACSIAKLDQAQEDLELSAGALRPLQQIVEQQNSMISMLQLVLS
uniref:BZIP domain-containing protein n=1 Tax=Salix viminalis TaxID=40686 RepID=A0A6N2N9I0_SALVM